MVVHSSISRMLPTRRLGKAVFLCLLAGGVVLLFFLLKFQTEYKKGVLKDMRGFPRQPVQDTASSHTGQAVPERVSHLGEGGGKDRDANLPSLRSLTPHLQEEKPGLDSQRGIHHHQQQQQQETPFNVTGSYLITTGVSGKLGNQMFQYASLLGIAAMNSMTPFYHSLQMARAFRNLTGLRRLPNEGFRVVSERDFATYDPSFERLGPGNTLIMQYFQSWKYFRRISELIRKEFVFADHFRAQARRTLDRYSSSSSSSSSSASSARSFVLPPTATNTTTTNSSTREEGKPRTRIGIHVRRGDMTLIWEQKKGYRTAPASYVLAAMDYMRRRHRDALFFLVTDDANWCRENLKAPDLVHVQQGPAEADLALLASCDHVIMTVGTFGWWGGYLAGGEVVYYWDPKQFVHTPPLPVDIKHPEDFFPPHWVPLPGPV